MKLLGNMSFVLSVTLLVSCGGVEKEEIQKMPSSFININFSLDSIANNLVLIPLSNEIPLNKSSHIKGSRNNIYYCQPWAGKISRFDFNGKYIDELDKQGRGLGEYEFIADFFIDTTSDNIFISTNINRIVEYDKEFNYLKDIKYPQSRTGTLITRWLSGNIHLFYYPAIKECNWIVIDTNGTILKTISDIDTLSLPSPVSAWQVFRNNNKLYRYYDNNDTIYEVDNYGFHPFRIISRDYSDGFKDFWDKDISINRRASGAPKRKVKLIIGVGKYWIIHFRKTEWSRDYYADEIVLYDIEENRYFILNSYNRKENQNYHNGIQNDWVGAGCIFPMGTLEMNGKKYLFSMEDSYNFLEFVNSEDFLKSVPKRADLKENYRVIADTLTIEDNPILILLELK